MGLLEASGEVSVVNCDEGLGAQECVSFVGRGLYCRGGCVSGLRGGAMWGDFAKSAQRMFFRLAIFVGRNAEFFCENPLCWDGLWNVSRNFYLKMELGALFSSFFSCSIKKIIWIAKIVP